MRHLKFAASTTLLLLVAQPVIAQGAPDPAPSPIVTASPTPPTYVRLIEADLLPGERVADPAVPTLTGRVTNRIRAAAEYKFLGRNFVEFEYRRWNPFHPAGFIAQPASAVPLFVPAQRVTEQDVFVNSSIIGRGHTYLATSSFIHSSNDGFPVLHSEIGFGVERLPDPTVPASISFSYFYFPEVHGKIGQPGLPSAYLRYKVQTYAVGGSLAIARTPFLLTAGIAGDGYINKQNAPSNASHSSATLGIGLHL